jgi:CRP-like cAMP-binding protein
MLEQYEFIKSIHNLSDEDYELFTKDFKTKTFKKGENIIVPGQIENQIFIIRSGVQMYFFDTEGKLNILGFVYPPNFCAIPESFFHQKPAKYYLTCLEDSELDYLTFENLQHLFDKSQQIERLFRKLSETVIVGLINRQIELRSTSIEERFKAFCQRSPHLLQLVPHKYIASYLAIDPTNFSKLYNKVRF